MLRSTRRCLHLNYQKFTGIWTLLNKDMFAATAKSTNVLEAADNKKNGQTEKKLFVLGDKMILF